MTTLNFDATTVEPMQPISVIPRGRYTAVISASEEKTTKKGDGTYLQLELTVVDGEFVNRKLWTRLNLNNPNETSVRIARSELAAICQALGLGGVADSEELHDKPLVVDVIVENKDGYESNRIKAYMAAGSSAPPPAVRQTPPLAPTAKTPPWQKRAA